MANVEGILTPIKLTRMTAKLPSRGSKNRSLIERIKEDVSVFLYDQYTLFMCYMAEEHPRTFYKLTRKLGFKDPIYHY